MPFWHGAGRMQGRGGMQSRCVLIKETLPIWPEPLEQDYSYMFFLCFRSYKSRGLLKWVV